MTADSLLERVLILFKYFYIKKSILFVYFKIRIYVQYYNSKVQE